MRFCSVAAGTRVREGQGRFRDGLEAEREGLGCPSWRINMTKAVHKDHAVPSRDIPFNKLVLSQSNVRHVKAGISIEQLAESIAQRTRLQSLNVRRLWTPGAMRPPCSRCRPAAGAIARWNSRKAEAHGEDAGRSLCRARGGHC